MRRSFAALILLSFSLAAQENPAEKRSPPEWASGEVREIRGKLEKIASGYVVTADVPYSILPPLPTRVDDFLGLNVEIKGWTGTVQGGAVLQAAQPNQTPQALVPAWWSLPFLLLLACIALFPFINKHFWEHHFHHIAMALGALMLGVYLSSMGVYGRHRMFETALDYFKFIALIGSLFIVTGGILVDISGRGGPVINTLLLAFGAVIANLIGTTGASALLIRPFLRINKERLQPFHVVLFIFVVSNCGGALTPIGDPPLLLGYIYGVPFSWTIVQLWAPWLTTVGLLLLVFFVMDTRCGSQSAIAEPTRVRVSGTPNFICLGVILFGVFVDKIIAEHITTSLKQIPIGALVMVLAAIAAYALSSKENLTHNEFSFGPIREVGFLFGGIFLTMVPALDFLAANAEYLGVRTPGEFYFATGVLSAFLDNAPTYLNFLSAAHGLAGLQLSKDNMPQFIQSHPMHLVAISLGSIFFGACSYIGNGPNFMVKAIADASGARTPGFIGYILKYTIPILLPIYILVWFLFLRT